MCSSLIDAHPAAFSEARRKDAENVALLIFEAIEAFVSN
jgi:hypothetical protein